MLKKLLFITIALVMTVTFLMSCSAQQPVKEISSAKDAINAAIAGGAEKYAQEELKALNDAYTTAMDEISTQDKKFFKHYDDAKVKLAKVASDAESLKMTLAAKKEAARNAALAAETSAKAAIEETRGFLSKAPMAKGSRADIEAFKSDVAGLESSLSEVQDLINSEDYFGASEKATAITAKAREISGQIEPAMQKVSKKS